MSYGLSRKNRHGMRPRKSEWVPLPISQRFRSQKNRGANLLLRIIEYSEQAMKQCDKHLTYSRPYKNAIKVYSAIWTPFFWAAMVLLWYIVSQLGIAGLIWWQSVLKSCTVEKFVQNSCAKASEYKRRKRTVSVNPAPTAAVFRAAWKAVEKGPKRGTTALAARLRLGGLLADLEPTVDQSFIRDMDGTIIGRRPGLKGWLQVNCPELLPHYKSLMSYKALVDKMCRALNLHEPDTLDSVLELPTVTPKERAVGAADEDSSEASAEREFPKSIKLRENITLLKSNKEEVVSMFTMMFPKNTQFPDTLVGLEVVVRAALGQPWMRRIPKFSLTA